MRYSEAVLRILELVQQEPGIRQCDAKKKLGYPNGSGYFNTCIHAMSGKAIERVWDGESFKLYLAGSAPAKAIIEPARPRGCWRENHPMNKAHGERFIQAFDSAFGLTPITEFPYLLKYLELLSVKAAMGDASPPRSIGAQAFFPHYPIQDETHPPRIAVRHSHSDYHLARCAEDKTTPANSTHTQSKRGDGLGDVTGGQVFNSFSLPVPPNYDNHFSQSSSAELDGRCDPKGARKDLVPSGKAEDQKQPEQSGTRGIFQLSIDNRGAGQSLAPLVPSFNGR